MEFTWQQQGKVFEVGYLDHYKEWIYCDEAETKEDAILLAEQLNNEQKEENEITARLEKSKPPPNYLDAIERLQRDFVVHQMQHEEMQEVNTRLQKQVDNLITRTRITRARTRTQKFFDDKYSQMLQRINENEKATQALGRFYHELRDIIEKHVNMTAVCPVCAGRKEDAISGKMGT